MKSQKPVAKKGCLGCLITFTVIIAVLVGLAVGLIFITGSEETKQDPVAIATLNGYCETVGNKMTLELGMVVYGRCTKEGEAQFHVMTTLTDAQIEWQYNYERDEIRQIWIDIAKATRDYCSEQGFTAIDEITVFLNSVDEKFIVMETHETVLMN